MKMITVVESLSRIAKRVLLPDFLTEYVKFRLFFSLLNFLMNIVLFHILIEDKGANAFNYFSFVLAVPSFLVFADFGLGVVVYNAFKVRKLPDNQLHTRKLETVSSALLIITITAFVALLLSIMITFTNSWKLVFGSFAQPNHAYIYLVTIFLIFLGQFPSLGHEIMNATGESRTSLFLISLNFFVNFSLILLMINSNTYSLDKLLLLPAISQFCFAVVAGYKSNIYRYISINHMTFKNLNSIIGHGLTSLFNLTLIMYLINFSRIYESHSGSESNIFEMSKVYTILIPICSLASSVAWLLNSQTVSKNGVSNLFKINIIMLFGSTLICYFLGTYVSSLPDVKWIFAIAGLIFPYSFLQYQLASNSDFASQLILARRFMLLSILITSLYIVFHSQLLNLFNPFIFQILILIAYAISSSRKTIHA